MLGFIKGDSICNNSINYNGGFGFFPIFVENNLDLESTCKYYSSTVAGAIGYHSSLRSIDFRGKVLDNAYN